MPPVMQVDIAQVLQLITLVAGKGNPRQQSFSRGSCRAGRTSHSGAGVKFNSGVCAGFWEKAFHHVH